MEYKVSFSLLDLGKLNIFNCFEFNSIYICQSFEEMNPIESYNTCFYSHMHLHCSHTFGYKSMHRSAIFQALPNAVDLL